MPTIKILQVFTTLNRGGAETNFMNYIRQMDLKQFKFEIVVHREAIGAYEQELQSMGIPIHRLPAITPLNYWRYQQAAKALLINGQYDIVHSHISELSIWLLKTAKQLHVPVRIVHAHSSWQALDLKAIVRWFWKKRLVKYANQFVACNQTSGNWLFGSKLAYVPVNNAINISDYVFNDQKRSNIQSDLNCQNQINICHVGSFTKVKNHSFLLSLFKQYHLLNPTAKLYLYGSGPLQQHIEIQAERLNLNAHVVFMGSVKNVNEYLQAMDIMVFPSLFEGLPVSIIEAQASGLPCVLSDTISKEVALLPDYVQFVSLDAPQDQWLMAINKALALPRINQSEAITAAGYDIQRNAKQLEAYYTKCVSKANEY